MQTYIHTYIHESHYLRIYFRFAIAWTKKRAPIVMLMKPILSVRKKNPPPKKATRQTSPFVFSRTWVAPKGKNSGRLSRYLYDFNEKISKHHVAGTNRKRRLKRIPPIHGAWNCALACTVDKNGSHVSRFPNVSFVPFRVVSAEIHLDLIGRKRKKR